MLERWKQNAGDLRPERGMSALYDLLAAPFVDFAFMRRALVACVALALGCGPIGVLLVLRRMSLIGDAMSHAVLPGAAHRLPHRRAVAGRR